MTARIRVTSATGKTAQIAPADGERIAIAPGDRIEILDGASLTALAQQHHDLVLVLSNGTTVSLGDFGPALHASGQTALVLPEPAVLAGELSAIRSAMLAAPAAAAPEAMGPVVAAPEAIAPLAAAPEVVVPVAPPDAAPAAPAAAPVYSLMSPEPSSGLQAPEITGFTEDTGRDGGDGVTQDDVIVISGTSSNLTEIHLTVGVNQLTAYPNQAGVWSATTATLDEGTHTVTVYGTQEDEATSTTLVSGTVTRTIVVDQTASDATGSLSSGSDTGVVGDDKTNDKSPEFSGTTEAGAAVYVSLDGWTTSASAIADEDGVWTVTAPTLSGPDGAYTATFRAVDLADNVGSDSVYAFTLDTTPEAMPGLSGIQVDAGRNHRFSDTTPTFHGTATAGQTIVVYDEDGSLATATADLSGIWTATPAVALEETAYDVQIATLDDAGNLSSAVATSFTIDLSAPDAPTSLGLSDATDSNVHGDAYTNDTAPVLVGHTEDNATVVVVRDSATYTGTADASGTFTVSMGSGVTHGAHTVSVVSTDEAGNTGSAATFHFTTDTVAPAVPTVTAFGTDSGSSSTDRLTNDTTPQFSGTAEAGGVVTVRDGLTSALIGTAATVGGVWTVTATTPITGEGMHSVTITTTDLAGNVSSAIQSAWTLDTVAPSALSALAISPDHGTSGTDRITDTRSITVSGVANTGETVVIDRDGTVLGSGVASAGAWSAALTPFAADGTYTLTTHVIDAAGNTSSGADFTVVIDTSAPAMPAGMRLTFDTDLGPSRSDNYTGATAPAVTGTAEPGSIVHVQVAGGGSFTTSAASSGVWTVSVGTPGEGLHTVTAFASDTAGNQGALNTATFTIDTTAPSAPVAAITEATDSGRSHTDGILQDRSPDIAGTSDPNARIFVSVGAHTAIQATANSAGAFTVTLDTSPALADGVYTASVISVDRAGNQSPERLISFTVDNAAPAAPTVSTFGSDTGRSGYDHITNDDTVTLTGTAEPNAIVDVKDGPTFIGSALANGAGAWSLTTGALSDATYTVTVTATDTAGNTGSGAQTTFTIDTTAPSAPSVVTLTDDSNSASTADSLTNDTTPSITGTAEANTIVSVTGATASVLTALVSGDGLWTVALGTISGEGPHTVSVTATDVAGNTGATATYAFTLDTIAPAAPTVQSIDADTGRSASDKVTKDDTQTYSGTAEPGATVVVRDNGTVIGTVTADGGLWSVTADVTTEGLHTISAIATDAAGNTGSAGSLTFEFDSIAPSAMTITGYAQDTGRSGSDRVTSDNTPTLSGTTEPNAIVTVKDGATFLGSALANGAGAWSLTTGALSDATYTVTVTATDTAGNEGTGAQTTFTIDTTAPSAPSVVMLTNDSNSASTADSLTNDTTPAITGHAEPNAIVSVSGATASVLTALANGDGLWTVALGTISGEGPHTVSVTATDVAGNTGATATYAFTLDTVAPSAPSVQSISDDTGRLGNDGVTKGDAQTYSGTAEPGSTVVISDNGTVIGTVTADGGLWSVTADVTTEGLHTISAIATDAAGNTGSAGSLTFEFDSIAPSAMTITGLADDSGRSGSDRVTNDGTQVLSGTTEPNAIVTVKDGATFLGSALANGAGAWSVSASALSDATYTVTVTATDVAGNEGTGVQTTFTIDTVAPATPMAVALTDDSNSASTADAFTNDTTPSITGTAEANTIVSVTGATASVLTALVSGDGLWTVALGTISGEGPHTVSVTATDVAGNTGATATYAFTLDTIAPAAPTSMAIDADTGRSASDKVTNDASQTYTGTAEPGATVVVRDNGTVIATVTADGGLWSVTADVTGQGLHTISATATDAAGNTGSAGSLAFTFDTVAPSAPSAFAIAGDADLLTNTGNVTLTGRSEANAVVTIDGIGSATADGGGTWTVSATNLAEGPHTASVTATDTAGNTGSAGTFVFTVDTTPPAAPTAIHLAAASDSGVAGDDLTRSTAPSVTGSAAGAASVVYTLDAGSPATATVSGGTWTVAASGLGEGLHTVTAWAVDEAGNAGSSSTYGFTVDTTPPAASTATLYDHGPNDHYTSSVRPTFLGSAEVGATVTVTLDGTPTSFTGAGDWTYTAPSDLTDGAHTVTVLATDAAGNTTTRTDVFTVVSTPAEPAPENPSFTSGATLHITSGANEASIMIGDTPVTGTFDGTGGFNFDLSAYAGQTITYFSTTTTESGILVFGELKSITVPGTPAPYHLVEDAGGVDYAALTFDLADLPAAGTLAPVEADRAPVDAQAIFGAAPMDYDFAALAAPDATVPVTADPAARRTLDRLVDLQTIDFGFGAEGMATPEHPYHNPNELGGW